MGSASETLVQVKHLRVDFLVERSRISVLRDVCFDLVKGEVLALIGETGCAKSVTGNALLHLLPENAVCSGEVWFKGQELLSLSEREFRKLRGHDIMSIPQSPSTALDPLMPVGRQVAECLTRCYQPCEKPGKQLTQTVRDLFVQLGFSSGSETAKSFPGQLSGGMCQRILLAMGIITHPHLLIIDEPTKAIDWSLRKQVLELLRQLNKEKGCTLLVITHDIPFAKHLADRIAVMYAGEIVERGTTAAVIGRPCHPYTEGLINAAPDRGFHVMEGQMPSFDHLPSGCLFEKRCPYADTCCQQHPPLQQVSDDRECRCWHPLCR